MEYKGCYSFTWHFCDYGSSKLSVILASYVKMCVHIKKKSTAIPNTCPEWSMHPSQLCLHMEVLLLYYQGSVYSKDTPGQQLVEAVCHCPPVLSGEQCSSTSPWPQGTIPVPLIFFSPISHDSLFVF